MTADVVLLRELIEHSSDALALIDAETLEYVHFNEAVARMVGLDRATLQREGPLAAQRVAGDDASAETLRARYAKAIAAHPEVLVDRDAQLQLEGRRVVIERRTRAIRSEGRWLILVASHDVSEREAAQDRVERLRFAADEAGVAIALIDFETLEYLEVNKSAADMLGFSKDEMMQLGPLHVTGLSRARVREMYDALMATPSRTQVSEVMFSRVDGTSFPAEVTRRVIRSGDRWVVVANIRDVTSRKKIEQALADRLVELQRSNEDLERFAYIVSHDLNEPLRMVSSYVQLLRRRYNDLLDNDGRDFIQFAVEGVDRMRTLLDDLLVYSRAGRTSKPPAAIDLQSLVRDVKSNLEVLIDDTRATVESPDSATLVADRTSLMQVLQNLVANAIKFTPRDRRPMVRIGCAEDAQGWTLSVSDNGIGIEPQYFDRIFVAFQRLHARGEYAGNGIGLAVCKKIVERYGGKVWVESTPGVGTTFRFTLPRQG